MKFVAVLLFINLIITVYSGCYRGPVVTRITGINLHSEGPHWHAEQHALYYVDIAGHAVHRYSPIDGSDNRLVLNNTVSFVIPMLDKPNHLVIGFGLNLAVLNWDGVSKNYKLRIITTVDKNHPENRLNDAKADVLGRLWAGTMGKEEPVGNVVMNSATLYSWNVEKCRMERRLSPVSISNGIVWSRDNSKMYYIDTPSRNITSFDYNVENGEISNGRTIFSFGDVPGNPDGMTIDSRGNLWIACWGGSRVINVDPRSGRLLRTIFFPVERITSVTFGGLQRKTMYVTTMRLGLNSSQVETQPEAGAVFKVTNLGVQGVVNNPALIFC